jgi:hypothetical protein
MKCKTKGEKVGSTCQERGPNGMPIYRRMREAARRAATSRPVECSCAARRAMAAALEVDAAAVAVDAVAVPVEVDSVVALPVALVVELSALAFRVPQFALAWH